MFLEKFLETRAGRIGYVAGLTLILTALGFWAAVEVGIPTSTIANAAVTDAPFAREAELAALQDLQFAQLAQDKAGSDPVRTFAAQVLADQGHAADTLKRAAWKENISLPTSLDGRDQAAYERLSVLHGPDFDRGYMRYTVRCLTDDLQVFRHEATNGHDEVVRGFASETIPLIEDHLSQARLVLKKVAPAANGGKPANGATIPRQKPPKR